MRNGFVEVTKEKFFQVIGPRNIHPRNEKERSVWEVIGSRRIVGISTPGYMEQGRKAYYLVAEDDTA
jgi:hypothetical protein